MKKIRISRLVFFSVIVVFLTPGVIWAIPIIEQGDTWEYQIFDTPDLWSDWASVDYDSFDWDNATWNVGNAAFGNDGYYTTYWEDNHDIALQNTYELNGNLSNIVLNVAVDNGFALFINGGLVAKEMAGGFTSYWEYTYNLDYSFFSQGINYIQVLAEDHGGSTFFDMQLTADFQPIPEPSTIILMLVGLACLFGVKRKLF